MLAESTAHDRHQPARLKGTSLERRQAQLLKMAEAKIEAQAKEIEHLRLAYSAIANKSTVPLA